MSFLESIVGAAKTPVVCDKIPGLENFDAARYMGSWIEQQHVTGEFFQPDSWKCNQALYTDLDKDGNFKVYNSSQYSISPRFGVHGKAKCPATEAPGECYVTFFLKPFFDTPNYQIIDTDYDTYSIIYSCQENDRAYLWFMSRFPQMDEATLLYVQNRARATLPNFDFSKMVVDLQGEEHGCKYATEKSLSESFLF